jgi:predicted Zn-dependent protease
MPTPDELYDEAERFKDDGKLDEAVTKLNELLARQEAHPLAHSALAVLFIKLKKPDEAIKHAQRACELEPNDPFSYTALSVIYQRAFTLTNNHQYIHAAEDAMAKARILQGGPH